MLSNCPVLTYYHKTLDDNRIEKWEKHIFNNVWEYGTSGSTINKGYNNSNKVEIIIPFYIIENVDLFSIRRHSLYWR